MNINVLVSCTALLASVALFGGQPADAAPLQLGVDANAPAPSGWAGKLVSVRTAAGGRGVTWRRPGGSDFEAVAAGAEVKPGTTLRVGPRTKALLALNDGGRLELDRGAELELVAGSPRQVGARVGAGRVVFDLPKRPERSRIALPDGGSVTLVGTRLAVVASGAVSLVTVTRGEVEVSNGQGAPIRARAGDDVLLRAGVAPQVRLTPDPGATAVWSESAQSQRVPRGLGSLTAHNPRGGKDVKDRKSVV